MGTRADFYVKKDDQLTWVGSIAWDGYPEGIKESEIFEATTGMEFLEAVTKFSMRDDFTTPEQGWPWPWETSSTTDYAYVWNGERVDISDSDEGTFTFEQYTDAGENTDDIELSPPYEWPDMSDIQNVTLGKRSGVMIMRG